jgi:hypothetical protein
MQKTKFRGLRHAETKTKRGALLTAAALPSQPYEVNYFARKHGLTAAEAREIIKLLQGNLIVG